MRMFFVIAILIITATSAFALSKDSSYREARRSGALAKIKIHVVDDLTSYSRQSRSSKHRTEHRHAPRPNAPYPKGEIANP